jgi:GH15 family glucan-1,4-alpha-glucosidase
LHESALLMPMMRFISPVDPMWLSTMKAIEKHLIEDTLLRRYEVERTHVDGLPGTDGSFTACSFWYVECLARAGELERAQLLFEKLRAMPTMLAFIPNSSEQTAGISGIFRKHLTLR